VLKALPGQLPFLQETQQLVQRWNPNRQQAYYLYGGQWPATPISPAGLMYNALYGRSANQERLIGSAGTELEVDDWVFLRPQRSAGLFELFNQLVLLRSGRLVGSWAANSRT
jgi:D-serine deaminase-like pyridoxal phosphate-dependent protein